MTTSGGGPGAPNRPSDLKPIAWSESFAMGDPEVDRQHRHFIDQVNELAAAATNGAAPAVIRALLEAMVTDARTHFAYEDRILHRLGYSNAEDHMAEHRRLDHRMAELMRSIAPPARSDAPCALQVALEVRELLLNHLLYHDLRYKSFLQHTQGR